MIDIFLLSRFDDRDSLEPCNSTYVVVYGYRPKKVILQRVTQSENNVHYVATTCVAEFR